MDPISRKLQWVGCFSILLCLLLLVPFAASISVVQAADQGASEETKSVEKPEPEKPKQAGPVDEYDRGGPRTSVTGFRKHSNEGDFEKAANYLDMRNLPKWMRNIDGSELAHQLKIVLDRALWIDLEEISDDPKGHQNDGLPSYRDSIGRVETKSRTVDILLQHVPRKEDGIYIWKLSNRTVAEIPFLYDEFGLSPLEEKLSEFFPEFIILGWQSWQWVMFLIYLVLSYLIAFILTWIMARIARTKETEMGRMSVRFFAGPLRFFLWIVFGTVAVRVIGPSTILQAAVKAGTALTIVSTWLALRITDLAFEWWTERLLKSGSESATVLLRPVKTMTKIILVFCGILFWLDNIGFNITTVLAGLGVGGFAVALAAQDTLKNFIGSILILLDKPYMIGERILVKGHDGVVEEIGLRSTRIRELDGHQTIIPNDEMSRIDIENVGRRPHIRRSTTISIAYDTPLAKVEKAVDIIKGILDNHEGMNPNSPPRVFFKEYTPTSLAIKMLYWYEPPKYWDFMAFNEKVNVQSVEAFEKEGIRLALPITEARLNVGDEKPLEDILGGEVDPEVKD
jgi:MscS family membrane protein